MSFYPDVKKHISPSALAAWHNQKSMFIRSYFAGEKSPETLAMKAGKEVHALIENGLYVVQKRFEYNEQAVTVELKNTNAVVYGIPDSRSVGSPDLVEFVDYKTGKSDEWSTKLHNDLKMKCTAWIVWSFHKPAVVRGYIEYIPTIWNEETHEVMPSEVESTIYHRDYTYEELDAFTAFIEKTIEEINAEYPKWLESSNDFVADDDVSEYVRLDAEIKSLTKKQDEIKERIKGQLEFGGSKTLETEHGSFFITTRKKWVYPHNLKIHYLNMGLCLEDVEDINEKTSIAKKEFEQVTPPASLSTSLGFRAKKQKK